MIQRWWCSTLFNSKTQPKRVSIFTFLTISNHCDQLKICKKEADLFCSGSLCRRVPCARHMCRIALIICVQTSNSSLLLPHLVAILARSKSRDRTFSWRSLHEVNTSWRCVLDDQWWRTQTTRTHVSQWMVPILVKAYPGLCWCYSRMRIWVYMA